MVSEPRAHKIRLNRLEKDISVDGPPPIFEGDDFPYWKIRMEAYLEALDVGILRAASQGFPKPRDPTHLQGDEVNYEKCNAKARNTIFRGL